MKKAYLFLAEGFEEVEAISPLDYLLRAGIETKTVSIREGLSVRGAHGLVVQADIPFSKLSSDYDCLIFPGGMPGTKNLAAHEGLVRLCQDAVAQKKLVAAICAAPALVLGKAAGVLAGRRFTCFPGMETQAGPGAIHLNERVVVDGAIISSQAAGSAGEFAIAIISALVGKEKAEEIRSAVYLGQPNITMDRSK